MVDSINTYGTNKATSTSGVSAVIDAAISVPSVSASSFVEGLSFQFPEIKGLRASSLVTERDCWRVVMEGEKEAAVPAKREAMRNFMVAVLGEWIWRRSEVRKLGR